MISHDFNGLLYLDRNQTYQEVKKSCDILNPVIWNEQGRRFRISISDVVRLASAFTSETVCRNIGYSTQSCLLFKLWSALIQCPQYKKTKTGLYHQWAICCSPLSLKP